MALARESDELADEPGGALDDALADLQRWRRGLRRGEEGRVAKAAVQFDDVSAIPGDDSKRCPPCLSPSSSTE